MSGPICTKDLKGHTVCPVNEEKFFTALLSYVASKPVFFIANLFSGFAIKVAINNT